LLFREARSEVIIATETFAAQFVVTSELSTRHGLGQEAIVPATKTRHASPLSHGTAPTRATATTANLIFSALGPLHGLGEREADLLDRAAAGLRFIQSTKDYTTIERKLFRIAIAELDESDAILVEAVACFAADLATFGCRDAWHLLGAHGDRRALWLAAILRLSEALCMRGGNCPDDVYASWSEDFLYLEFDGDDVTDEQISLAECRSAALEALAGRRVIFSRSAARWRLDCG
jgi:hypothetical protein